MSIFSVLRRSPSLSIGLSLALLASLLFVALTPDEARAATFVVNSVQDEPDTDPGDGDCEAVVREVDSPYSTDPDVTDTATACTLRAAVEEANASGGADSITLPAGHYELDQAGNDEDDANTGDLDITDDLEINGTDSDFSLIDAEGLGEITGTSESNQEPDRVFHVVGDTSVAMDDVTIRGGVAACSAGGGILMDDPDSSLTLTDAVLRDNAAEPAGACADVLGVNVGGAIAVDSDADDVSIDLNGTTVIENSASNTGGGIHIAGNDALLDAVDSVIAGNSNGIVVAGDNVDVNLDESAVTWNYDGDGIALNGEDNALEAVATDIERNDRNGIVANQVTATITVAEDSFVSANENHGLRVTGNGSSVSISESTIGGEPAVDRVGEDVGGNRQDGVQVSGQGSSLTVQGSDILENGRHGVHTEMFDAVDGPEDRFGLNITDSDISDNGENGVHAQGAVDLLVQDSQVTHNERRGIIAEVGEAGPPSLDLDGLEVNRNNREGLFVDSGGSHVTDVDVSASTFNDNDEGGIRVDGGQTSLLLSDSGLYNNHSNNGAGLDLEGAGSPPLITTTIEGSTFAGNTADRQGGGIWNSGLLTIVNSTFSQNIARAQSESAQGGGALFNDAGGEVDLEYVTMFRNQTTLEDRGETDGLGNATRTYGEGEAIYDDSGASVEVTATIVALEITNTAVPDDRHGRENCGGTDPISHGDNIEDMDTCNFHNDNDLVHTDPNLYALRDKGEPTETHMPEPGSPAIDHDPTCSQPVDQRDEPRPFPGAGCDTGSVEVQGTENLPTPCPTGTDFCVDHEFDHVPDEELCGEGSDCTLREAVISANEQPGPDSIFVPNEDYFLTLEGPDEDESATGDLDVTDELTIVGELDTNGIDDVEDDAEVEPASVIDATYLEELATTAIVNDFSLVDTPPDRVLHVPAADSDLTLDNMAVQHGRVIMGLNPMLNYGGGAILVEDPSSSLALADSWVFDNRADGDGGGIHHEGGSASTLDIDNSRVAANDATNGSGGGIAVTGNDASITIDDSTIGGEAHWAGDDPSGEAVGDGNTAISFGGGVHTFGDRTTLETNGSLIQSNYGTDGGGGIRVDGTLSEVDFIDSRLLENESDDNGGAVDLGAGSITLASDPGSELVGNRAEFDGGAIAMQVAADDVTLDGTDIRVNFAGDDGGVVSGPDFSPGPPESGGGAARLVITDASVFRNLADGEGGAAYTNRRTDANFDFGGVTFEENRALGSNDNFGGGVLNIGAGRVDVTDDSEFISNSSELGAGAVYLDEALGVFEDTTFEQNHAFGFDSPGGAIWADTDSGLRLTRVNLVDNVADNNSDGGAVFNGGAAAFAEDVWFSYNFAHDEGGAVYNGDGGDFEFDSVTFSDNRAEQMPPISGGGLYNAGSATLVNSTFSRNEDRDRAGAIYNNAQDDNQLILRFVTIYDHETDLQGDPQVPGDGVSIYNDGNMIVKGTIVANSEGENCQQNGTVISNGFNFEDQDTCGFSHETDEPNMDPELDQLDDNGGFTPTHAPLDGSAVIDHVDPDECPPPDVDQRDEDRPQGDSCDSGSVEGPEDLEPTPEPTDDDDDGNGGGGGAGAEELDVDPEDADNTLPADDDHTLEAEVDGDQGEEVDFKIISGPNADGSDDVDFSCDPSGADDTCEESYTSNGEIGTDVICGWVDTDDDDVFDDDGSDRDGGDCGDEDRDETESNDETDVVEKGWTGGRTASPSPTPTESPSPRPTPTQGPCAARPGYNVITGTSGDDVIVGTDGNDLICARAGDDVVRGRRGNDIIFLGAGRDTGFGGRGQDQINGNRGRDDINGNRGGDDISGGRGRDVIAGNIGPDTLHGNIGNDRLFGGPGPDFLGGGPDRDRCRGGPGVDTKNNCEF